MSEKLYYTGKTRTTTGPGAATRSSDGSVDLKLPEPHPMAENLFAAAWSACYLAALQVAASQQKITLGGAPSAETEIKLLHDGAKGFYLRARLDITVPGVERAVAQRLVESAHGICPYSKAVHGNIEIETNVVG